MILARHRRGQLVCVALLVAAGCVQSDREVELGPAREIEGLVTATTERGGGEPPRVLQGVAPELSADVRQALESQEFQVVVRVMIKPDNAVMGVAVLEFVPEDATHAKQYADQVANSIWQWQFESARDRGESARGYLDLHFRQGGGG